ncbi:DUF4185 domain-containing protein [Pseudonocardia endophytica]|uniref:DUF4185 domain-containing protein n=1 Tax=Pseudonocardia endophytica TaxID=401976 RepID=UPI001FB31AD5|nr:DUF4185 domain-containing protein [Pseudonocardia endophytica]
MSRVTRRAVLGALGLGAVGLLAGNVLPVDVDVVGRPTADRPPAPIRAMRAEHVGWVTGAGSANRTAQAGVAGTDLGIMWDDGTGDVLVAYGDTFGRGWAGHGGEAWPGWTREQADWRSNVLARSTTTDLSKGLTLDSWITDVPGHARQVIPRDHRPGVREYTVIPTSGIAIGTRNLMSYMSVRRWHDEGGRWDTNYAGIAYSDDRGATWHKPESAQWANTPDGGQGWQMCAFARERGRLYVFGTPNGRWGPVRLSRVREDDALDLAAYEQWTGKGWTRDQARAVPVIPAPASELSVIFHEPTAQWLAAHFNEALRAIVVHTAPALTGPWSRPRAVVTDRDFPQPYGAFFHPSSATSASPYFQMSQWGEYNTRLMRLDIETDRLSSAAAR